MALELLGFENDITRSRIDLEDNFKILDSDKAIDEIFEKISQFSKSKKSDLLNTNIDGILQMKELFKIFYQSQIAGFKTSLQEEPLRIEPIIIGGIELLFYFSNIKRKSKPESEEELIEELFPRIEKYFAIMEAEQMNKYNSFENPKDYFEQMDSEPLKELSPKVSNFDFWFAMTLRQTAIQRISDFLNYHSSKFESKEKYSDFLEIVRLEHSRYFSNKTNLTLERILDKKPAITTLGSPTIQAEQVTVFSNSKVLNTEISSEEEQQTIEGFSNEEFETPKFKTIDIYLKAKPWQIRKFLSFFHTEKNGSSYSYFIESKAIEHLKKYGITVPESPLKNRFTLYTGSDKRSLKLALTMFYKFYAKHKKDRNQKKLFVQFLKHTFTNFDNFTDEENPNNFLRAYPIPTQNLNFKFEDYI